LPEIGLFPLELVLLPTERVPLHIFEPRYKELIGECLEEGLEFGLVLEDEEGRRAVGTQAAVVEGRERFRLLELTEGRDFLTGEIEPVEDEHDPPEPDEVESALGVFRRLVEVAESDVDEPDAAAPALSFELASRVDFGLELKQEILELRSERRRLVRLVEILGRAVDAMTLEKEVRERASGNGRVSPR
jgi:Lon protease-like protein